MIKLKYLKAFEFTLIPVAWSEFNSHNLMFHFRVQKTIKQILMLTNLSILNTEKDVSNAMSCKFPSLWKKKSE